MRSIICLPVLIILSIIAYESSAQIDDFNLTTEELNEILKRVDTLSEEKNYHVILTSVDTGVLLVDIFINDRLGGIIFKESGMNICRYYELNNSIVFVYEIRQCECEVPPSMIRKPSLDQYAYLDESPFYDEKGFFKSFLAERDGIGIKWTKAERIEDNSLMEYLIDH